MIPILDITVLVTPVAILGVIIVTMPQSSHPVPTHIVAINSSQIQIVTLITSTTLADYNVCELDTTEDPEVAR